jgi:hypothetical protein
MGGLIVKLIGLPLFVPLLFSVISSQTSSSSLALFAIGDNRWSARNVT